MDKILLSAGLAFLIAFFAIPIIIRVAKEKKLFDEPDDRKVHKEIIPTLGGLGIFAGFILAILIGTPPSAESELQYFVAASIVLFFIGIKDDIVTLSVSIKIAGQLIAAGILVKFGGTIINDMHGFLGIHQIPNIASIVLSFFTIIVVTNSFNLIDGVDGLAGSLSLLTSAVFGIYFYSIGQLGYAVMSFSLLGALISFLIYNFSPAKIFMGDTGSLLVGLVNSFLVIKFINIAEMPTTSIQVESAPAVGFAILMIPLFDTLRLFTIRILSRRSPFNPDRNHLHHYLLDIGLSHRNTTIFYVVANLFFIGLAFQFRHLGTTLLMGFLFSIAISFTLCIYYLRHRKKNFSEEVFTNSESAQSSQLFKLASESVEID